MLDVIVDQIASEVNLPKNKVKQVLKSYFTILKTKLRNWEKVKIRELFTITPVSAKRKVRTSFSGKEMEEREMNILRIKAASNLFK